jgi:GR25 family glycosyltransferase involved in LPS biosynthesis
MGGIPTYVVNLAEDKDRLEKIREQLNPSYFEVRGCAGFYGHMLPDGVCLSLTRDKNSLNHKGALGVMMSHVLIWERVSCLVDRFALILEDDVVLHNCERLVSLEIPEQFDFAFCGDQTSEMDPEYALTERPKCAPAFTALPTLVRKKVSTGGYGYLLSPSGAKKLLDLFLEHLYFGHVDVRMMAYACDLQEVAPFVQFGGIAAEIQSIRSTFGNSRKLSGFVINPALVTHVGMTSRRDRENVLGRKLL